jgi:hypothetical protein
MSIPRRHHYVPESYLSRFTDSGMRDGNLWVFDRQLGKVRKSDPKNSGHQRDFYRLDEGVSADPNYFEKAFGELEGNASLVIDEILKTGQLPSIESMEYLVSFVGLQAVRIPFFRSRFNSLREQIVKSTLDMACANEAQWEYHKQKLRETNPGKYADVPFEQAREFLNRENFKVEIPRTESVETMMTAANTIVDRLYQRNWGIAFAEEGELITCDNPVILTWTEARKRSPGFGLPGTEVIVPLSKNCLLYGTYEELPFTIGSYDREGVALVNYHTCTRASRFIYGPSGEFIWLGDDDQIVGAEDDLRQESSKHREHTPNLN